MRGVLSHMLRSSTDTPASRQRMTLGKSPAFSALTKSRFRWRRSSSSPGAVTTGGLTGAYGTASCVATTGVPGSLFSVMGATGTPELHDCPMASPSATGGASEGDSRFNVQLFT
eukprot:scaffold4854_cov131-Isochrysis_galbana.AAC.4